MNQFQIYLAIVAAPVATMVTVLVGLIINNSLFNAHVKRLDEKIDTRYAQLDQKIDTRYAQLNDKIDAKYEVHESHLRRVEEMLLGKFAELYNRLTRIEAQLNLN